LADEPKQRRCIAVVRVRGTVSASMQARETLKMLHLTRNNYAVLVDDRPSFLGMIRAVRDYVTFGEPSKAIVAKLMKEKGRLAGGKELTDEYSQQLGYKSLDDIMSAVSDCRVEYWKLTNIQPVFKLHPPTKGFKGKIKKSYASGGELGYRGEEINELLRRML
jgi:large subunit ribosomal protein L30